MEEGRSIISVVSKPPKTDPTKVSLSNIEKCLLILFDSLFSCTLEVSSFVS